MMSQFVHSLRPVRRCVIAGLGLTILLAALAAAEAADWRSWRGPENKGVTLEADLPLSWGTTENVAWRVDLPDRGNSTPIVVGDLVIVTQSVEETKRREVIAFDAENGTERWRSGIRYEESEASHRDNPFCAPSPVSDGERVYVWFGSAGFYCYDLGGRELWKRDLGKQQHMWGYAASPVLYKDLCILSFGPGVREFLIAMDKRSGDTVWKHEGLTDAEEAEITIEGTNGNAGRRGREETETDEESGSLPRADAQRGAWGTPIVVRHAGRDELVVSYPRRLVSYDPASGDEIWTCRGLGPLVYSSPIAGDGVVVILGGYYGASMGVRLGGRGDVTETHRIWHTPRSTKTWLSSGVIYQGHIYVLDMQGIAHCLDLSSGEPVWSERLRGEGGNNASWSSLIRAGELIYATNRSGDTFVFRAAPEFELLHTNSVGEMSDASLVPADGRFYYRTNDALWCLGER